MARVPMFCYLLIQLMKLVGPILYAVFYAVAFILLIVFYPFLKMGGCLDAAWKKNDAASPEYLELQLDPSAPVDRRKDTITLCEGTYKKRRAKTEKDGSQNERLCDHNVWDLCPESMEKASSSYTKCLFFMDKGSKQRGGKGWYIANTVQKDGAEELAYSWVRSVSKGGESSPVDVERDGEGGVGDPLIWLRRKWLVYSSVSKDYIEIPVLVKQGSAPTQGDAAKRQQEQKQRQKPAAVAAAAVRQQKPPQPPQQPPAQVQSGRAQQPPRPPQQQQYRPPQPAVNPMQPPAAPAGGNFCPACGTRAGGSRFCGNCAAPLGGAAAQSAVPVAAPVAQQGMITVMIPVPAGAGPGTVLQTSVNGRIIQCCVPQGVGPGQAFPWVIQG